MYDVRVYVYDVSKGLARSMSTTLIGKQLDGIWHTGVVVYGQEFYFGGMGGIEACNPGGTILGAPDRVCDLGQTEIPFDIFMAYLEDLSASTFRPSCYHLLDHNCNTFSSEVSRFLTGKDIPPYITGLPAEVLSTPFGQMIRPFVDSMSMQPSGGHNPFQARQPTSQTSSTKRMGLESGEQTKTQKEPSGSSLHPESRDGTISSKSDSGQIVEAFSAPIIIEAVAPDKQMIHELAPHFLTELEMTLLEEILEYASKNMNDLSWSLGHDHIYMFNKIMGNKDIPEKARLSVLSLLQKLVLNEDFITLLQHDKKNALQSVLQEFYSSSQDIKINIAKMLTNGLATSKGGLFLTSKLTSSGCPSFMTLVTDICTTCVLAEEQSLCASGIAIAANLSRYKLSDDTVLELASALLQCLARKLPEESVYYCLTGLDRFTTKSQEICELAAVMGLDWAELSSTSTRTQNLCSQIQLKLS